MFVDKYFLVHVSLDRYGCEVMHAYLAVLAALYAAAADSGY